MTVLLAVPRLAGGTSGGPELCEVLGWEPMERRVYVLRHNRSDDGPPWLTLAYFDLSADRSCRQMIAWGSDEEDETIAERSLQSLRKRLKPLVLLTEETMWRSEVLAADTLSVTEYSRRRRFRVQLTGLLTQDSFSTIRVTTFDSPSAFVPRLYAIPGRSEKLGIVAFTGVGSETGYETQVPVLLQSSCGDVLDVEWKGFGK